MGKIFVWGLLKTGKEGKPNIIGRHAEDFNIYRGCKKTWIKSKVL